MHILHLIMNVVSEKKGCVQNTKIVLKALQVRVNSGYGCLKELPLQSLIATYIVSTF